MALLTIGDGKHIGDWDVNGNGMGGFDVRRLDKVGMPGVRAEKTWVVVATAHSVPLAVEALKIVMQQDLMLILRGGN